MIINELIKIVLYFLSLIVNNIYIFYIKETSIFITNLIIKNKSFIIIFIYYYRNKISLKKYEYIRIL